MGKGPGVEGWGPLVPQTHWPDGETEAWKGQRLAVGHSGSVGGPEPGTRVYGLPDVFFLCCHVSLCVRTGAWGQGVVSELLCSLK